MDDFWKDVWRIINGAGTSTYHLRGRDGFRVRDASRFRGLPMSKQKEINDMIASHAKEEAQNRMGDGFQFDDYKTLREKSARVVDSIVTNYSPRQMSLIARARDTFGGQGRDITPGGSGAGGPGFGGVANLASGSGVIGQDPNLFNQVTPNIWLSPMDVANIASQKGIPEMIIRKKSKSILLNGPKIRNPMLTPEQHDKIDKDMVKTGLAHYISQTADNSLWYGGAGIFPRFKKDTPLSMGLPMKVLAQYGILGKGQLDRWTVLDRWNIVNIPNWNPTAKDFLDPMHYFIPFLGTHVSGERMGRVVTGPQPGYWGNISTLGWGLSDLIGWLMPYFNYENVMASIPKMINQMSLLVRTINVDGALATDGEQIMEDLASETTMRVRDASAMNPINMDVIGKLEAIQRDFAQVPELTRLVRQDWASKAGVPEELIWSSERGAFASGDTTDSAYEKQSEGTRYTHIDMANQLRRIAQIQVINALGVDRDVLKALPYTTIEFDNPKVTNAKDKAEIGGKIAKSFFDLVAGGAPVDAAMDISQQMADYEFKVSNELMDSLKARQSLKDDMELEKHEKEMELMEAQIDAAGNPAPAAGSGKPAPKKPKGGGSTKDDNKKGHSYADRLEQRKHEIAGSRGMQGLQKAEGKQL